jgi:hypothetical protein
VTAATPGIHGATTPAFPPTPMGSSQTPAYYPSNSGISSVATPGGAMLSSYDPPASEDESSECHLFSGFIFNMNVDF